MVDSKWVEQEKKKKHRFEIILRKEGKIKEIIGKNDQSVMAQ